MWNMNNGWNRNNRIFIQYNKTNLHREGECSMNILLLFFAIPIAVIIFSIALQKILKCPLLVAAVIFAILLIVTFTVFDTTFLVAVIIYTILSFLIATLVRFFCQLNNEDNRNGQNDNGCGCGQTQNSIQTAQAASRSNNCGCCRRRF